jgi:phage shock protein C
MAWTGAPFRRSSRNRWIAGVCGGLAAWIGWPPLLVRILFVVISILLIGVPGWLVYIILWALVPTEA